MTATELATTAAPIAPLLPAAPTTRRRSARSATRALALLGPPLVALVAGWCLIASRAPNGWASALDPKTFNRWDAGQYLGIARHGYRASTHCPISPTVHLCGNITWFPGYPGLVRLLAATHIGYLAAALVIAWICWYLTLLMVWVLSRNPTKDGGRSRASGRTSRGVACLALAAVFPGQVYFAALFPISLVTFAVLLCIWSATRTAVAHRTATIVRTSAAGVIAGLAYPLALAALPALFLTAMLTRSRRIAMLIGAAAVVAGYALVPAYAQLSVGTWNAYFISEREEYGVGVHNPLDLLNTRYHQLVHPSSATLRTITEQGAIATLLLVVAIALTVPALPMLVRARRSADMADLALLITACVAWLIPYVGAGQLSIYRSEACLIVLVPLLRRLPVWAITAAACAAAVIAYDMAPLFFSNALM